MRISSHREHLNANDKHRWPQADQILSQGRRRRIGSARTRVYKTDRSITLTVLRTVDARAQFEGLLRRNPETCLLDREHVPDSLGSAKYVIKNTTLPLIDWLGSDFD
jgi:hypothetical protein